MRLAVIGLRNHAMRMARLASSHPQIDNILLYHPDPARIGSFESPQLATTVKLSSDFGEVERCDAVIIASPHGSHLDYILRLVDCGPYILCEKPPASSRSELGRLATLRPEQRARLAFNFNYAFSGFAAASRAKLADESLGRPLAVAFTATHGLAFKQTFASNWRLAKADPFSTIVGNLGIHYLHLVLDLFGPVTGWRRTQWAASPQAQGIDCVAMMLDTAKGVTAQILLSYAAPFTNTARLFLTDGLITLEDGRVTVASPRDTFGDEGRFTSPPQTLWSGAESTKEYFDRSLEASLDLFLKRIMNKNGFVDADFFAALDAAKLVLDLSVEAAFDSRSIRTQ